MFLVHILALPVYCGVAMVGFALLLNTGFQFGLFLLRSAVYRVF